MKPIYSFFTILTLISVNQVFGQNINPDKRAMQMIYDFYKARSTIGFTVEDFTKIDSLQTKYCTQKLRKQAWKSFKDGHDLLTKDRGINSSSLEMMTVLTLPTRAMVVETGKMVKLPVKKNTYLVNYTLHHLDPVISPVDTLIELEVSVVNENGTFKISKVK